MGAKDLFITPIYIILLSLVAYFIRPMVTSSRNRNYFLAALYLKFFGAIALGLIYQFWYSGGDTFNYFTNGSKWIYEAFWYDFQQGLSLLFDSGGYPRDSFTFQFNQHIWYYKDPHSFFIVRIAAFLDLFTFHTYSATALLFSVFSFSGSWAFYSGVCQRYPDREKVLAFALLLVPSVIFWGSGILKDTVTLGALGWLTFAMLKIIGEKNYGVLYWFIALVSVVVIAKIKIYIIICYLPTLAIWMYWDRLINIRNVVLKWSLAPFLLLLFSLLAYYALTKASGYSDKYSVDKLAERAAINAYDIRYGWGARTGGDGGYDIGIPDGSWQSMVRLMPAAINVSLFRPYIWEVRNPLMLLSALEAVVFLVLTVRAVWSGRVKLIFRDPFLTFCLAFSLLFAFAVGVSTANFGTLMRYKIPMIGFITIVLVIEKPGQDGITSKTVLDL